MIGSMTIPLSTTGWTIKREIKNKKKGIISMLYCHDKIEVVNSYVEGWDCYVELERN